MTFDLQKVDTLETPSGGITCVLMKSFCYFICKDSDFFEYFAQFLAFKPEMTFDLLSVK